MIGGRYDGVIWGREQHVSRESDEFTRKHGLDVVRREDNVLPVSEIVPGLLPFAVVLPDGGRVDREGKSEQAWQEEVQELFAAHRERIAVAIDCHC